MTKRTASNSQSLYQVRLDGGGGHPEYLKWYQNVYVNLKGKIDSYEARPNVYVVASAGGEAYVLAEATYKMKAKHKKDVTVEEITKYSLIDKHRQWKPLVDSYFSYIDLS